MDKNKKQKINEEILALFMLILDYKKTKNFKGLLIRYKTNRDNLKDAVNRIYAKYSKDGQLNISNKEIKSEVRKLEPILKRIGNNLYKEEDLLLISLLYKTYQDIYSSLNKILENTNKNIYTLEEISKLKSKKINGLSVDNRNKINKEKLINKQKDTIEKALKNNKPIDEISKQIDSVIETGVSVSKRLIEDQLTNAFNNTVLEIYKKNGVEKVRYNSILEKNTCSVCESLDGVVFYIDKAPSLPLHPNCECWYEIEE